MKHYLSICAIFKNEAPYMREWLEFHRLQGVDHFYLIDNESTDSPADVLAPYLASGLVTCMRALGTAVQMPSYMAAIRLFGRETRWMAFIDIDEFLFSPSTVEVARCLEPFESFPGVGANWCVYGTSGHLERPEGLVTESYTRRTANEQINMHIKSIVDPSRVADVRPPDPHHFLYTQGQAVNERFQPTEGPFSRPVSFELFRVNHYWPKSEAEARVKATRHRADNGELRAFEQLTSPELNEVEDHAIAPWLPDLRSALVA